MKKRIVKKLNCKRCGHSWLPQTDNTPVVCPRCKSYKWQEKKVA